MSRDQGHGEAIAVVGMSGRFPQADDLESFWRNLRDGVEAIARYSEEELRAAGVSPAVLADPQYVKAAGTIEGFESFDAAFFDFSPGEARWLDPHHRLFLEHSWQALENAGYDPRSYEGIIGVFGGMASSEYAFSHLLANPETASRIGGLELRIFNDKDFLASLTAYKLDLRGPSLSLQTACSTSLVSTCVACQSLLAYQCDLALSGGVAVASTGRTGYFARAGVFSPDGHCRAFDAQAAGTVSGYGVGVLVLKRLDRALADGDTIHAVIRGWASNNDGALKVGYTAPSVDGQAEAIAMAHAVAGVEAETIGYVECHGTGTPLGDQIEIAALTEVFRQSTEKKGFCAIGSVKTNIGHLDAAAGVASLIKTIQALEHRELPPSLGFETPNPQIDFGATPFYVQTALAPWPAGEAPRRAGVSAFAVGGVNAHLVLEEAPAAVPSGPSRARQLLVLSARSESALAAATANLAAHLRRDDAPPLADVAHTLRVGRRAFERRAAWVVASREEALAQLESGAGTLHGEVARGQRRRVAFMFPGLGNHYVGMARGLYESEPVFRRSLDRCAELLAPRLGVDFRALLYPEQGTEISTPAAGLDLRRLLGRGGEASAAGELLATRLAQPVVFAVEWALAELWRSWGVEPAAMLGFSIGEYVAATLAGVLALEDALMLVAERARLIDGLPAGAMLAVPLAEREVESLLGGELSISAVNGPEVTVVGGPPEAIAALERRLGERGLSTRRLETSHAFHSRMMEPAVESFRRLAASVPLHPPEIPFVSNVTGTWISAEQATDPAYWARHLRAPVRFADGVETLWEDRGRILLEVGPGQALSSWALQLAGDERMALASMRHAFDPQGDDVFLLTALARLWLLGARIDWNSLVADERRQRVPLPTYPFERRRFWVDRPQGGTAVSVPIAAEAPPERTGDLGRWSFEPVWQACELAGAATAAPRRWLILLDDLGLGLALAERLETRGAEVVLAAAGRRFEKVEPGAYCFDPAAPASWAELIGDLRAVAFEPERIVHLLGVTAEDPGPERALELGGLGLIHLAQALGDARGSGLELAVVASHLCQVGGQDEVHPEKAALLGPVAVIPLEMPGLRCRALDVGAPAAQPAALPRLADALLEELLRAGTGELVAYRGTRRWERRFAPAPLAPAEGPGRLRQGGVYLITGGLGGVGLTLAEALARACAARLVLVGRSELPPRTDWDSWLAEHPAGDPTSATLRRLLALETLGAQVRVLTTDVAERAALAAARAEILARFGAVHGIVHAAGIPPGGLLQIKTRAELLRVLAPKTAGTRALLEIFGGDALDFVVLCSSLTALTGAVGLVDHTAANAVLDAHAQAAASAAPWPVVSLGWDTWLEVGQAAAVAAEIGLAEWSPSLPPRVVGHPLLEQCVETTRDRAVYRALLKRERSWLLDEHRLLGQGLVPGTAYLELARAAWVDRRGDGPCEIAQLVLLAPLLVPEGASRELRTTLLDRGESLELRIESRDPAHSGAPWTRHAETRLRAASAPPPARDLGALAARCPERIAGDTLRPRAENVTFGPRWQCFHGEARHGAEGALAALELPAVFAGDLDTWRLHPALLDAATGLAQSRAEGLFLPLGYEKVSVWGALPRQVLSWLEPRGAHDPQAATLVCDLTLLDPTGRVQVEIRELTLRRVDAHSVSVGAASRSEDQTAGEAAIDTGIRPAEGAEVFLRLLAAPRLPAQLAISTRDLPSLLARLREERPERSLETRARLHQHQRQGRHPRPQLATRLVPPRGGLESEIAALWCELLALEEVGIHDGFFDLGGDSLLATQLLGRLQARYRVELPLRAIFEAPTVAELAVRVVQGQVAASTEHGALDAVATDALLAAIEGLSEAELEQLLAAEKNHGGDHG